MTRIVNMIPCKGCMLKVICRNKIYYDLLKQCSIINNYLYEEDIHLENHIIAKIDFWDRMPKLYKELSPALWFPDTSTRSIREERSNTSYVPIILRRRNERTNDTL